MNASRRTLAISALIMLASFNDACATGASWKTSVAVGARTASSAALLELMGVPPTERLVALAAERSCGEDAALAMLAAAAICDAARALTNGLRDKVADADAAQILSFVPVLVFLRRCLVAHEAVVIVLRSARSPEDTLLLNRVVQRVHVLVVSEPRGLPRILAILRISVTRIFAALIVLIDNE